MLHQQGALFCMAQTLFSIEVTVGEEEMCVNERVVGSNYRVIFPCIIAVVSPLTAGRSAYPWKILK